MAFYRCGSGGGTEISKYITWGQFNNDYTAFGSFSNGNGANVYQGSLSSSDIATMTTANFANTFTFKVKTHVIGRIGTTILDTDKNAGSSISGGLGSYCCVFMYAL